jgi:uncharacterized protein (TIGR02757 family)
VSQTAATAEPRTTAPARLRRRRPWRLVAATLEGFLARFPTADRLAADPVRLAHVPSAPEDREIAALVASCLAFGRAASIIAKAEAALATLGPRPAEAARRLQDGEVPPGLRAWRHRWIAGRDLAWLLAGAGRVLREQGSLRAAFAADLAASPTGGDLLEPMARFARRFRPDDPDAWHDGPPSPSARYLLPVPNGTAAAKRLCLFLRWMGRRADGVDLGLWPEVPAERLTIPLDTHVARIGVYLGLTARRTAGWATAREITESLRRLDPADPTRFDFALSHLGIMGGCPRRRRPRACAACDLAAACRL